MKNKYLNPQAEEIKITLNDVLTSSPPLPGVGSDDGEGNAEIVLPEQDFSNAPNN